MQLEEKTKRIIYLTSIILVGCVVLIAVAVPLYKYLTIRDILPFFKKSSQVDKESQEIITAVSKLAIVPVGEVPTLASVTDKDKLPDTPFFQNAENGDRVLLYTQAQRAYLYRPSENKIVESSPLTLNNENTSSETQPQTPTASASPIVSKLTTITLYNGTSTKGLTLNFETKIANILKKDSFQVVARENASKQDYTEGIIIDVTGSNDTIVKQLAEQFKLKKQQLPEDEVKPQSDILIILGSNYSEN